MTAIKSIVLITGAGREEGIGFGLAKRMNELGFEVILTAREKSKAEMLTKKISNEKNSVTAEAVDITNDESVERLAQFVEGRFGRLDILINNAGGVLDYGIPALKTDFNVTKEAFETNLFGAWRMVKYMHPLLKKGNHPRIVNVSSGAGSFTHPIFGLANHPAIMTSYGLSKLALNGLTVKLAKELAPDKILVNAVNPGFVATAPGMDKMGARSVTDSVDGIIWTATLPDDGPTGKFFEDKKQLDW
jgi:NAD(P)-dependent dehydrogenase (short-subunit alcohol dehydrogenase family)